MPEQHGSQKSVSKVYHRTEKVKSKQLTFVAIGCSSLHCTLLNMWKSVFQFEKCRSNKIKLNSEHHPNYN